MMGRRFEPDPSARFGRVVTGNPARLIRREIDVGMALMREAGVSERRIRDELLARVYLREDSQ